MKYLLFTVGLLFASWGCGIIVMAITGSILSMVPALIIAVYSLLAILHSNNENGVDIKGGVRND